MRKISVKSITVTAVMTALAVVISIAESFIPSFGIPGVKLGLANIVILILLYVYGWPYALVVDLLRVFLASLLRGTIFQMGFFMSLAGALLSLAVMILLKYAAKKLHVVTVSVIGSLFHVLGQIVVGILFLSTPGLIYYLPFLALSAVITGIFVGFAASRCIRILDKRKPERSSEPR